MAMKPIVLIAAMDSSRAIGRSNDIPWRIPGEQKVFRELTMGNALIMGRMTYLSLPGPLPGRYCIVLTRSPIAQAPGVRSATSISEALSLASEFPGSEIAIGGGQEIYELFLPIADRIHLTMLDATFGGDRFFPLVSDDEFSISTSERVDGSISYTRYIYERRSTYPNPLRSEGSLRV
jgi:dihydrofolate reductase